MGKHVYVHMYMYIIAHVMYTSTVCTQYPASACTYIYSDVCTSYMYVLFLLKLQPWLLSVQCHRVPVWPYSWGTVFRPPEPGASSQQTLQSTAGQACAAASAHTIYSVHVYVRIHVWMHMYMYMSEWNTVIGNAVSNFRSPSATNYYCASRIIYTVCELYNY